MATTNVKTQQTSANAVSALHGISLPRATLKALEKRGIYCVSGVSLEHQHLANRYVLRGVESGGAVADVGHTCAFLTPEGDRLPWLQSIDSIAVNGRHSIYIAESLVRIEMLRTLRTYDLAVSLHTLQLHPGRTRPEVASRLLFRGRDGVLPIDLWKDEHKSLRGQVTPVFYDRSGEPTDLPRRFEDVIRQMTKAVCCIGCRHTHVGVAPSITSSELRG
jgi:hypothetical protein